MAFADFNDVLIYAPDLTVEDDAGKVATLLEQAEDLILVEFPDLQARVGDGRTPEIRVVRVESEMVASVMNNPRARQSESQTVGGLSTSHTINVAVASGLLRLTADQRALLNGTSTAVATGSSTGRGYSVSLWG
ncbi:hypothetical protein EV383_4389 [Pseudonocardia sediminis]|uniref:Uncharacterized protein n=1 Tax=Pseudonocardia sediminis TaxID=1397368 RepID=A0A4Q7V065_PSEST|nr:hypothetical protein [Pseudonocardia sediminis]RZT87465.1 hypothetical protein EV383_4389 [Pseudonocardia sediminis]